MQLQSSSMPHKHVCNTLKIDLLTPQEFQAWVNVSIYYKELVDL